MISATVQDHEMATSKKHNTVTGAHIQLLTERHRNTMRYDVSFVASVDVQDVVPHSDC